MTEGGFGVSSRWGKRLSPLVAMATLVGGLFALGGQAFANVTAVTGSAYGVSANISLFGGQQPPFGPAPRVTLPSGGSTIITASAPSENVTYGPAQFFSSGKETVTTKGSIGTSGSVTSTTSIASATQPAGTCLGTQTSCIYAGPFTATSIASSCTATQTAVSGKTTFVTGKLVTATDTNGNPTTTVAIPANPPANDTISGYLYAGTTDKETFTWIFNQQKVNADGSITVTAAHQILIGPTAKGDLYIGQAVCGVTKG
ncbi:MAG: hypothetical protein M3083_21965 [Actinomycetota bacterium]|nr:hypothetical protein [Actinomycetota bacterium]